MQQTPEITMTFQSLRWRRIDFWQCIEDSNEYILRCTVRTPYRNDSQIKLRCLDRFLNEVGLSIVNFGSNVTSVGFTSEKKQLETQLSIRMPKAFDRYYFIIDDQNHPIIQCI